jgi:multifunctional methyltransferase subunit TRM112
LPDSIPAGADEDEGFLRSVHALAFDIHLEEGNLVCPHCGRAYPVTKGVPNMLLRDDEI